MKMKAAVLHSTPGKLAVEEIDIADPGPGEVRVKIAASGLCHTDWETMRGYQPVNLPAVIGHEGAGVVEAIGPGVRRVKIGDHVACSWSPNCGHCFYCDQGQPILCEVAKSAQAAGVLFDGTTRMSLDGQPVHYYSLVSSHAEYNIVPEQAAVPLPREFPLDRAALLGCAVMTGYGGAVNCARIAPQTSVVDASADDPVEVVRALTQGRGADYAIEAAGQHISIRQALAASRPGARIVILGKTPYGEEVTLPFYTLMGEREIVRTSYGMSRPRVDFPRLAHLYMEGRLLLDEMISMRLSLEEINTGFDELEKGNVARSLVVFNS